MIISTVAQESPNKKLPKINLNLISKRK